MNISDTKRIDPKEFMDFGYLQEVNRYFLHPLGMALEVYTGNRFTIAWRFIKIAIRGLITNNTVAFSGVWDYRDDSEGMSFADGEIELEKVNRVRAALQEKEEVRLERLGYVVQPID